MKVMIDPFEIVCCRWERVELILAWRWRKAVKAGDYQIELTHYHVLDTPSAGVSVVAQTTCAHSQTRASINGMSLTENAKFRVSPLAPACSMLHPVTQSSTIITVCVDVNATAAS